MAVLFSKVALLADDCESTVEFLVCGIPQDEDDLKGYTAYDDFVEEHSESEFFDVEVESYVYGDGETQTANEYEIEAFAQRGEDFVNHPDVQITQKLSFEIINNAEDFGMELE